VSEICTSVLAANESRTLILRSNTAGTTYVYAKFWVTGSGVYDYFYLELGCYVAGVKTVFQTTFYPLYVHYPNGWLTSTGYAYWLSTANGVQTFEVTDYAFTFTTMGLSVSYTDGSHVSQKGASYRSGGFADSSGVPGSILSWDFYDSGPTSGPATATVLTSELDASVGIWVDLATTTDQVTVNVGSSGLLLVSLSADITPQAANVYGAVSFALSGANTLAAAFENSILYEAYTNSSVGIMGNTVLLTGLNPGATTVKLKYYNSSNSVTVAFSFRKIAAIPL